MIQKIIRYIRGYVKVQVQGYSTERFLNLCSHHQIYIWGLESKGDIYELYMTLQGFHKLRPLVRKTHTKVQLSKRYGLPFFIYRNRKRQAFPAGLILCIGLLFFYSTFIWDIHFEGNEKWTNEALLEFLETKSVMPAMPKRKVDCAQIVKDIRARYDDIVWVSASIDGSRLRIQIKENEDTFKENVSGDEEEKRTKTDGTNENTAKPTDLIAAEDGIITSVITRRGVPQVHVGDTVKKGDVLVSGRIEVLNDAQEVISCQYCRSDADIYADTQMEYQDSMPLTYDKKQYDPKKQRKAWYIRLGQRMISVGSTKTKGKTCEIYTSEHRIKLGENFYLPLSYGEIRLRPYTTKAQKYTKEDLQMYLTEKFESFLEDLEEKGIQIYENNVKIHVDKNSAVAEGTLYLNRPIAEETDTEILELKGTNLDESIGTGD